MIRILLADDHALFRAGTRRILEEQPDFRVVAEAGSGLEAVTMTLEAEPDVAILDIGMSRLNGLQAAARIQTQSPATAILVLSMHCDERYVSGAVRAGARGFLLKDSVEQGLIEAIRKVHAGGAFFSPAVARILNRRALLAPNEAVIDDPYERLTDREKEVYHLLAEGHGSKEIAAQFGISVHTVETHRTRIMDKMDLHGIAELVLSAVRRGFVT
jgi:two-component system response regulator NreC